MEDFHQGPPDFKSSALNHSTTLTSISPTGWRLTNFHNAVEELYSGLPRTIPDSSKVEDFNQGPPELKSSTLNHSATLPSISHRVGRGCIWSKIRYTNYPWPYQCFQRQTSSQKIQIDCLFVIIEIWLQRKKKQKWQPAIPAWIQTEPSGVYMSQKRWGELQARLEIDHPIPPLHLD